MHFFLETTTTAKTGGGTVAFKMKFTTRKAADRWSFMKQLLTTWQEGHVIFSIAFSVQKHFVATTPHLDLCSQKGLLCYDDKEGQSKQSPMMATHFPVFFSLINL